MALDFFAGCVGGAAGIIVGHPLDTVKVQIQTQCPDNPKYRGTFHCLSSIARQESIAGLYRGVASPLYGVTAVNAIIFGVYGSLKPLVSGSPGNDALWAHFIAGSASGAVQSFVAAPMELVKTRMQLDESSKINNKGPSAWQVLKNIYMNEGGLRRGVFKGWGITLAREIPGFGAYFTTYEALTRGGREITTPEMLMAGGMAGVVSWIACFPMDVVKTRLQSDTQGRYVGAIDCCRKTLATEGYRAFFRGLNSTLIRAFPTNAATFTAVTWIMRFAQQQQQDNSRSSNVETLFEQWGRVGEKVVESFQLKAPQYSFLTQSLLMPISNILMMSQCEESYMLIGGANSSSSSGGGGLSTISSRVVGSSTLVATVKKNLNECEMSTLAGGISEQSRISSLVQDEETQAQALLTVQEQQHGPRRNSLQLGSITATSIAETYFVEQNHIMGALAPAPTATDAPTTSDNSSSSSMTPLGTASSPPVRAARDIPSGGSSHGTGSFPADLSILAEILDLPLVVLQSSMDGKPITLFNIILTWLRQKTPLSLCKCLDALDQCVCLAR